jgi:hypothetical protein
MFFVVLGVVSLFLAMGKYNILFHYLLFDFPFYSKVRIFARHLMEFNLVQAIFIPVAIYYILNNFRDFIKFLFTSFYTFVFLTVASIWFFLNPEIGSSLSKLSINSVDLFLPLFLGFSFLFIIICFYVFKLNKFFVGVFLFLVMYFESLYVFYNISPSYVSNWWGKRENIVNYLENIKNFDSNYRICYLRGFPLLFNGVSKKPMLNYYEPVIPFEFVYFFNIWMNGSFLNPFDYFFVLNNYTFSLFSIKYVCVNNEFRESFDRFVSLDKLVSYPNFDSEIDKFSFSINDELIRNSKNVIINFVSNSVTLKSDSQLMVNFRNKVFNKALLVSFRVKISKMDLLSRYRRIFFNKAEGLGVEIKRGDQSLGYYFVDDYYFSDFLGNDKGVYCTVPFVLDFNYGNDFENLTLKIYPLNSFSRLYQISDLEVYSFPLAVRNFSSINTNIKPYLYVKSFMGYDVYENVNAFPIVFSPKRVEFVDSLSKLKYKLLTLNFDGDVFVSSKYKDKLVSLKACKVRILEKKSNYIDVLCKVDGKALVVFNDMYYRGWKAKLNEQRIDVIKVNNLVKGVIVDRSGLLRFYYEPFPMFLLYLNIVILFVYPILFLYIFYYNKQ